MNGHAELDRYLELETGNRRELMVRFGAGLLIAIYLYVSAGWLIGIIWFGVYVLLRLVYYGYLRYVRLSDQRLGLLISTLLSFAGLLTLQSLPLYLVLQRDPGMVLIGAAVLAASFISQVRRCDTHLPTVLSQVGLIVFAVGVVLWVWLPRLDLLAQQVIVGCLFCVTVFYFVEAVRVTRQLRLQSDQRSKVTAQQEKLAALGRLVGGVSHDFNNALVGISGSLELYHEVKTDADRAELVRDALEASLRAEALTKQLLVFARRADVSPRMLEARGVVEELAAFAKRVIPASIDVTFRIGAPDIWVEADRDLLVTALINLLVNARDAVVQGGTIEVSVSRYHNDEPVACATGGVLPPNDWVVLSVKDTGVGIAPEDLLKTVEPFYTTKQEGEGTGLGLPMVLGLAESCGGCLSILSEQGAWTDARIILPEAAAPAASASATAADPAATRAATAT
ncbi:sensory box histidine kinase/response regulator [Candidatus Rhodobacter oscarellae]|uniref:histidine kinase n=2 Tax=Candidatus Rhodobacter oscarellae TaxID=1675527 RepID=A0A0J9DZZ9_9RHOB|nr:sensory box histidine kinase/response regulator [Candidatus Rhodobacter lobularis]